MHVEVRTYKYLWEKMTGEKFHKPLCFKYVHNIEVTGYILIEMTWAKCFGKYLWSVMGWFK